MEADQPVDFSTKLLLNADGQLSPPSTPESSLESTTTGLKTEIESPSVEQMLKCDPEMSLQLDQRKDWQYLERRRKNNEAAKRSRDGRRKRELVTSDTVWLLIKKHHELKCRLAIEKDNLEKLKRLISNSEI